MRTSSTSVRSAENLAPLFPLGPLGARVALVPEIVRARPLSMPLALPRGSWTRAWVQTTAIAAVLLVGLFAGYELLERFWLRDQVDLDTLSRLHVARGVGTSVLLALWAMVGVYLTRRRYDASFTRAYADLQKEAEARMQALMRSEAFTERLFDALRDRLIVLDRSGRVVKANRVATDAMGGSPCLGKPCNMLGTGCQGIGCVAQRSLHEGRVILNQIRTDPRTGRIYSIDAYPVPDPEGGQDLVIEAARDVTETKQVEVHLRAQEKLAALGVLSAGIAHDIGNPLASMSSELEMLETEQNLEQVRESLAVLRRQISRISRTLKDMTDFARRRTDEPHGWTQIQVAAEDALRMVRHDPRARRIRFATEIAEGLPELPVPEDQLVMVLVNLLINAFDAMPEGGALILRAERDVDAGVRLAVIDTGHGMSPDVLRRATEPLFTTKPGGRGTGLGLSVSADLMRSAGGTLELISEEGRGTTVLLRFPPRLEAAHG